MQPWGGGVSTRTLIFPLISEIDEFTAEHCVVVVTAEVLVTLQPVDIAEQLEVVVQDSVPPVEGELQKVVVSQEEAVLSVQFELEVEVERSVEVSVTLQPVDIAEQLEVVVQDSGPPVEGELQEVVVSQEEAVLSVQLELEVEVERSVDVEVGVGLC